MIRTGVVRIDGLDVAVTVRRVARMNVRVHPPHGDVRLSAPPRTSHRSVVLFVRSCRPWIDAHRARMLAAQRASTEAPSAPARVGREGEVWSLFGTPLQLEVVTTLGRPGAEALADGRLRVRVADPSDRTSILHLIDRWERRALRAEAGPMLDDWSIRMGVTYEFLGVRRMSTRWGSCVPERKRIWLSLALVDRPVGLLEYVVVHELAHLIEASHGPRFRAVMDTHLPDWKARRLALDRSAR